MAIGFRAAFLICGLIAGVPAPGHAAPTVAANASLTAAFDKHQTASDIVREYVPELARFGLLRFDAAAAQAQIAREESVQIPFSPAGDPGAIAYVEAKLAPYALGPQEPFLRVLSEHDDGSVQTEWHELQPLAAYTGETADTDGGVAAALIRDGAMLAMVALPYEGPAGSGLSFVEPLDQILRRNGAPRQTVAKALEEFDHVVYSTAGLDVFMEMDDNDGEGEPDPGDDTDFAKPTRDNTRGNSRAPFVVETITIEIQSDQEHFVSVGGDLGQLDFEQRGPVLFYNVWTSLIEPLVANGVFDITIDITGLSVWIQGGPSSTNPNRLLEEAYQFATLVGTTKPISDIGHLYLVTGKDLDGSIIGKAWKIGGFDDVCNLVYELSNACKQSLGQAGLSTMWQQIMLVAHELGHVMGATHSKSVSNSCVGSICGPSIMQSTISNSQSNSYSTDNASAIALGVSLECNDPC